MKHMQSGMTQRALPPKINAVQRARFCLASEAIARQVSLEKDFGVCLVLVAADAISSSMHWPQHKRWVHNAHPTATCYFTLKRGASIDDLNNGARSRECGVASAEKHHRQSIPRCRLVRGTRRVGTVDGFGCQSDSGTTIAVHTASETCS